MSKRTKRVTCVVTPEVNDVYRHLAESMRTSISSAVAFHLELTRDIALEVSSIADSKYDEIEQNYASALMRRGVVNGNGGPVS